MTDQQYDPGASDSRATDFVFGELSAEDTKQFQRELDQSPELQVEVDSIREAVAAVQAEFESGSRGIGEAGRKQIADAIAGSAGQAGSIAGTVERVASERSNTRRALIGIAIAASVLLIGMLTLPALQRTRTVTNVLDTGAPAVGEDKRASVESSSIGNVDELAGKRPAKSPSTEPASTPFGAKTKPSMNARPDGDQAGSGQAPAPAEYTARAKGNADAEVTQQMAQQVDKSFDRSGPAAGREVLAPKVRDFGGQANRPDAMAPQQAGERYRDRKKSFAEKGKDDDGANLGLALKSKQPRLAVPSPFGADSPAPVPMSKAGNAGVKALEPVEIEELEKKIDRVEALRQQNKPMEAGRKVAADPHGVAAIEMPDLLAPAPAQAPAASLRGGVAKHESKLALSVPGRIAGAASRSIEGARATSEMSESLGRGPGMSGDQHEPITDNPFKKVIESPLSTFSIDVDTASYAKVRMYLMRYRMLPRPDAVRIEELLNYFTYDYEPPKESDRHPFAAKVSVASCPWNGNHRLARVAIKGKAIEEQRPASNLVFLLDVSGSMNRPNKLPLVVEGMKMLTKQLGENDSVAIVVYAGAAGLVLDATSGDEKETILGSLDRLRAGGSTNGGQGIQLAYETARDNFITGGTNRVILCTDGDFNVGVTGTDQLVRIAEENAKGDIFLSVLGFGMGNHNDAMMEKISNKGNGNYAFIDSKKEAQKVLVEQMGGTLVTIAKDVKIQIEFNPKQVAAYRLIGYENRVLAAQDFNDDKKDAGEIGAGHTVTALYELLPADGEMDVDVPPVDDLKFQQKSKLSKEANSGELLELKLRYKQPTGTESTLIRAAVRDEGKSFSAMDGDFKFSAAVASFGMLLRNSPYKGDATFAAVEEIAGDGISEDKRGRRNEFLEMVVRAKELSGEK